MGADFLRTNRSNVKNAVFLFLQTEEKRLTSSCSESLFYVIIGEGKIAQGAFDDDAYMLLSL